VLNAAGYIAQEISIINTNLGEDLRITLYESASRIGLGHVNVAPGDKICAFYGGISPFILRPRSNNAIHKFVWKPHISRSYGR
jgi:hypothetical protein